MTNKEYIISLAQMYAVKNDNPAIYSKVDVSPHYSTAEQNKDFAHIPFYSVGRNSSHSFYLGVDDKDQVYYRAYSYYDEQVELYPECKHNDDNCICFIPENIIEREYDRIGVIDKDLQTDPIYIGHW